MTVEKVLKKALKQIAELESECNEWDGRNLFIECVTIAQAACDEASIKYRPKFIAKDAGKL